MSLMESSLIEKPCIMDGYGQHLIISQKMTQQKANMYINLVRKFHNYIGKSYIDIKQRDIRCYLNFLVTKEHLSDRSLYLHLASIKKFYQYLWRRGDIPNVPSAGVAIKYCKKS